ncbi:XkdX family protein [Clostridium estertheticum]|nr:XkdX family protein [Clostridium estertheticum]MBZ9608623.1 XkdX family protein [Clostridium estertheticum]
MFNALKRLHLEGRCTIEMLEKAVIIEWITELEKLDIIDNIPTE